jgi:hypothetical protein
LKAPNIVPVVEQGTDVHVKPEEKDEKRKSPRNVFLVQNWAVSMRTILALKDLIVFLQISSLTPSNASEFPLPR